MHLMYYVGGYVHYVSDTLSWVFVIGAAYGAVRFVYDGFRLMGLIERSNREKAAARGAK